ncbi:uncharacterized protein si:dkey-283b1.6 [Trichomycterus rosablanca]|uniref:uncharacterized protein si:dkey-283b1.6 n=1 Tax=Trichomycterus rosablanca TaxID=2290929 RepID=UPI002F35176B
MDFSLPIEFRIFQILVPVIFVLFGCIGLCNALRKYRQKRRERAEAAQAQGRPSVFVIPSSPPLQEPHTPSYGAPPTYSEVRHKPDFTIPHHPPPSYSESVSSPYFSSSRAL